MLDAKFFNAEYEKVVLGVMLIDNSLIDIIAGRLNKDCFSVAKYKYIYEKIITVWHEKGCANILALSTYLNGKINAIDLAELTDSTPSSSGWEFYVKELINLYTARRMKYELGELTASLNGQNTDDVIAELNSKVAKFMEIGGNESKDTKSLVFKISEQMQEAFKNNAMYLGYDCGYENLNQIVDGFQTKQMYVVGARPSIGKTAFALGLLSGFAKNKIPCSVFSLEMSAESLFYRLISSESKIPSWQIRKGICLHSKESIAKIQSTFQRVFEWPVNIFDTDIDNDSILYSKIRYEAKINGSKVIMIDHLGLIESSQTSGQRYVDVGRITKTLHKMAKELDVCIILLCQVARAAEGKKPTLAELRESGNIEQDADVIMFLHRERDANEKNIPTEVIVEKNRDGRIGTAKFLFQPDMSKFVEDRGQRNNELGEAPDMRVNYGHKVVDNPRQTISEETEQEIF